MSAPSDRLQRLTLDDGMPPRSRLVESSRHGRRYDLGSLTSSQYDAVADGLKSDQLRLLPVLSRAVFPEEGYMGFNVSERHAVRIPVPGDNGNQQPQRAQCDCPTFTRDGLCPHFTWLYDGVHQVFKTPQNRSDSDSITPNSLQNFFSNLATTPSSVLSAPPITEVINRLQQPPQTREQIDQNVLDTLAIFEPNFPSDDSASRKKPRRDGDSPPEAARSNVDELKTCLDLDRAEFFANTPAADSNITDIIKPGDLLGSLKGLLRHSNVIRDDFNHIVDNRYKAKDFVNRLRFNFDEWYFHWKQYRNDNRRTVAPLHIQQFATKVRSIIADLRRYDDGVRVVPDSYYDDAIELAIQILGKLCGAELEYQTSSFVPRSPSSSYAQVEVTNIDIFKDHTRQSKQGLSGEVRDRNLFYNLIISPPPGSPKLIGEVAHLLTQWDTHLTPEHMESIEVVGSALVAEFKNDGSVDISTAKECLKPLQMLMDTHGG